MKDKQFFTNRVGSVGASQIAGLVYHYKDKLLLDNIISQDIYQEISNLNTQWLETPWSIKTKIGMSLEQLQSLNKITSNPSTIRGNELERPTFDKFLWQLKNAKEVDDYNKKATQQYKNFKAIATIDYLAEINGVECIIEIKTKNDYKNYDDRDNLTLEQKQKICKNLSYELQVAMQLILHIRAENAIIATQLVFTRDKQHDIDNELVIYPMWYTSDRVDMLKQAVAYSLKYFDTDYNDNFVPNLALEKDFKVMEVLNKASLNALPLEAEVDFPSELINKVAEMNELKEAFEQYTALKDEIDSQLKAIAKELNKSVTFKNSPYPYKILMTTPTTYTQKDIDEKQKKAKKEYEDSLELQAGDIKTATSVFKLQQIK